MKVVIIGGVAGGASAAARLRRLDESAEIVMLERGSYISYANCGLPYYIGGVITQKGALTLQTPESFWKRFQVEVRVRQEAVSIDPVKKLVLVKDLETGRCYEENYDRLIFSPGAEPVKPPIPGIDSKGIFTLRNIPDTFRISEFIQESSPKRAIVVGGGYIGVEMAENLSHAGLSVTIVERLDHLINILDEEMACDVHRYLRTKGIEILVNDGVESFQSGPSGLKVLLSSKKTLEADLVLMSAGVRPESKLAREAGLTLSERGAVVVNDHLQTSQPDIYAVGDVIQIENIVTKDPGYIPLAGPANKQGRIAADNICGLDSRYRGTQGTSVLKLFDMTVAATGISETAARRAEIDCDSVILFSPSHATYYPGATNMSIKVIFERGSGRLLGAQLVGFEGVDKRCDVLAVAIRAGMTAYDLTELELAYAPPFSSAKDPVNMAGFVIENLLTQKVKQCHWRELEKWVEEGAVVLDVRTPAEYQRGHIEGALFIPLDELRDRLEELVPFRDHLLCVHCQSGLRSYIACRLLSQKGFDCCNVNGGYRLYDSLHSEKPVLSKPAHPCGIEI